MTLLMELIINHEDVQLDESLSYKDHKTTIIDKKVRSLCSKNTVLAKVLWHGPFSEETTW
jgi:hypothetical protein